MSNQNTLTLITQHLDIFRNEISTNLDYYFEIGIIPNSKASHEIKESIAPKDLETAYNQGSILIQVALDHFSALVRSITFPALAISPWANARSVLETSALSSWLLDPNINIKERISRSYAFRCDGLQEQHKYACAIGNPDIMENTKNRLDNVLKKADKLGLVETDSKGKARLVQILPDITSLVKKQLNEELALRLFSGVLHAHNWALLNVSFTPVVTLSSGKILTKHIKLESIGHITVITINSMQKAIMSKYKLFGWPSKNISVAFEKTRNYLQEHTINNQV